MKSNLRMLGLALCLLPMYLHAETRQDLMPAGQMPQGQNARSTEPIPVGTIIPVSLNSSLHSGKSGNGDAIMATVLEDVPFATGETLPAGSKLAGHIVEAITPGKGSDESRISFQFDQVRLRNRTIPITTNLRALASKAAVLAATPQLTSSEYPDNQIQIGGDQISYGREGAVMVGSQVVGKYTSHGVLAYGGQDLRTPCRGTIGNNDRPQAFWFFSVNACGAYGFGDLTILHSGSTEPLGEVTLTFRGKAVKVGKGSAMLLYVDGTRPEEAEAHPTLLRPTGQ
jgi:hypothetical protein